MALAGIYDIFQHWGKQTVWIYSDPHFGNSSNIKNWPSDEEQITAINSCVGRKDTLILLGDVGNLESAKKLKGYKILICGNHDSGATTYKEIFNEVYTGPLIIGDKLILSHEPIPNLDWAVNIHGHVHDPRAKNDKNHFNVCSNTIGFKPIHFNKWLKEGHFSKIESLHRKTIDKATERKEKRKKK